MSKDFIPPEFKMYFEPQVEGIIQPEGLVVPELVNRAIESLGDMSYHTFVFGGTELMSNPQPAVIGNHTTRYYDPAVIDDLNRMFEPPKPTYTIQVFEDLKKPAHPYMCRKPVVFYDNQGRHERNNIYEIHVPKHEADLAEPNDRGSLLASWLHEIGHVIACIFNLPAARQDPRLPFASRTQGNAPERVLAAERERPGTSARPCYGTRIIVVIVRKRTRIAKKVGSMKGPSNE